MKRWLPLLLALCACPSTVRKEPRTGYEWLRIPAGQALLGCAGEHDSECRPEERQRTAAMPELWLGRTEVTVDQYAKCVTAKACSAEPMKRRTMVQDQNVCNGGEEASGPHPINCITWSEAAAFCAWIGGRLPAADELEYAARGAERRIHPWGDQPPTDARARFNTGQGEPGTDAVGLHPAGASPFGIQDLSGNVAEWTSSDSGGDKEVRGGSWKDKPPALRSSARELRKPARSDSGIGFRCALPR